MFVYLVNNINLTKLRPLFRKKSYFKYIRLFSDITEEKSSKFIYEPDLTSDQQKYIIEKLNEANIDELRRYKLPKHRVKKLDDWRKKNGKFNSIIDVLDVEGLGVKSLDKLCKNILQGETEHTINEIKDRPNKSRNQFLTPLLSTYQAKEINSAVGLHLYATGVSWAKISRESNFLTDWNCFDYNLGSKKLSPSDALQLVINLSKQIPTSDVYIFEAPISVTPTAQQSSISVNAYVQRVQLLSMLITLLSTSPKHNPTYIQMQEKHNNDEFMFHMDPKVYFLRHRLPARLFRTLIGTERVSAETTVLNILNKHINEKLVYTPISVSEDMILMYDKQVPVTKEVLGQALLLTIAFMDICVYQNENSLKFISSNTR